MVLEIIGERDIRWTYIQVNSIICKSITPIIHMYSTYNFLRRKREMFYKDLIGSGLCLSMQGSLESDRSAL